MDSKCYAPAVFPPGYDPLPIVQKAGWAPGTGEKNLARTGFRPSDHSARAIQVRRQ